MRSVRATCAFALLFAGSCATDVGAPGVAISDPLALIDDVDQLRLFVFPSNAFTCDELTGGVDPMVPDVPEGMVEEAIVDITLTVMGSSAMAEVDVPRGEHVVYVRGRGTDPVTMRRDQFIAQACATQMVAPNETRDVRLVLLPIVGSGMCGDGTLSPDEQCEDSNNADGDGCSATCRSESFPVSTTTTGVQNNPAVAGAVGMRWISTYDSENTTVLMRMLGSLGEPITTPSALLADASIDDVLTDVSMGAQLIADVAMTSDGRIALAFVDFNGGPSDIRVAFVDNNRAPVGPSALVVDGLATAPAIAFAGNGASMVVYEDDASASGLMGQAFAAGSTTAVGAPFEVGTGLSAAAPAIAGTADGFVVVFAAGGGIHMHRFGADGSPVGAPELVHDAAGAQDTPSVAALPDGRFLVAWADETIDGAGSGIGARAFGADGVAVAEAFALNSTTAGRQSAPSVAAGGNAFVVAFLSDGGARARMLSNDGDPIPNRDIPPTTADFEVAASATEIDVAVGGPSADALLWMANTNQGDDIVGRLFPMP